jgi:hypothetical protein
MNSQENESNPSMNIFKNKKKNNLKMTIMYDNMISSLYTLHDGKLDKEKIANQSMSFTKHKG